MSIILVIVLILGIGVLVGFHEQNNIIDYLKLRNYTAPSNIAAIATSDTMTSYGRKMFYVNHPQLTPKTSFSSYCPNGTEQTVVLGCYHAAEDGIYILSVDNAQLNGIEQVTSAHEMLHAAYDQLSSSDKAYVDNLLTNYYNNGLTDPVIRAQIASYKQSEPGAVVNEMHSLFGTQVASLPPALETYYSRYLTDRATVVNYYLSYESAFSTRQNQIKADDQTLTTLNSQIDNNNRQISSQLADIQSLQVSLNNEKNNGQITEYNASVPGFNTKVDDYNNLVVETRSLIDQYNNVVNSRNSIVLVEQQLVQAISSTNQTLSK
ncbi:MAG TPA: hypothetical protein VIH90_07060 [Candidatus Saccharimonadales bacterium]